MNNISKILHDHYQSTFFQHGPTVQGVDWGNKQDNLDLRYSKMLEVIEPQDRNINTRFLDVGCGYGGLYEYSLFNGFNINYTGVDIVQSMMIHAQKTFPNAHFECHDILDYRPEQMFDYVVCNGILTQKLTASIQEMESYSKALIRKLYSLCKKGIAFNLMSSKVNFTVNNLFYKSPVEMLSFCLNEITSYVKIDHSYGLYEYTVYLYRDEI
ncbi:MAG: class I SAM-dependent methyltransferase [Methanomicrobiales archaeon]|nr:class I SAM-dependent methyltransferase [Methanomicrobiales archaeon]